ncbi:fatty acid desaturase [Microbulbifer sp. ALW1]|uniref:fatty acid desaturase family protein n=1 Tax=Microbulbifer sp. (strain ALW1) TaxID=1516059 RepID=UPI00135B6862|nr:fatty acid desaturase [Microbulbifer sp. ALW1]
MKINTYSKLREELHRRGLFTQNSSLSAALLVMEPAICAGSIYFLCRSEILSVSYLFWLAVAGISMFRCFSLLHECGHRAMFRSQRSNTLAGYFLSAFCLVPFTPWRELHLQHHKWVGVIDRDPTQAGLLKLREASFLKRQAFRWVWWFCVPIPSIQLIFSVFWLHPFKKSTTRKSRNSGLLSLVVCLVPQVTLGLTMGMSNWLSYILPAIIFYFFWFEAINFTHHSGIFPFTSKTRSTPIPLHEQDSVSRTSSFSKLLSTVLAYNFNFHTEHHYFPTVPWHNLPEVYSLVQASGDLGTYEDVPMLGFSAKLRLSDPVKIYIDPVKNLQV